MVSTDDIRAYQPIIERTRLRFPRLAGQGWLYLTNTYRGIQSSREHQKQETELCMRYGRVFDPRDIQIRFDLPAYGGAEFAHVVLPDTVPVFIRPGVAEVLANLQADFSSANEAWWNVLELYRHYFRGVTAKRYSHLAAEGWMWVLDLGFRKPQRRYDTEWITRYCMEFDHFEPAEAKACPRLGYYPFASLASELAYLVPVFVRTEASSEHQYVAAAGAVRA